jgi:hypothetical protein
MGDGAFFLGLSVIWVYPGQNPNPNPKPKPKPT